jgi:dipeptidyl aminopeptidase/acylaminoacyl peptidase
MTIAYVASTLREPSSIVVERLYQHGRQVGAPRRMAQETTTVAFPLVRDTVLSYRIGLQQWGTAVLVRGVGPPRPLPAIVVAYPGSFRTVAGTAHALALANPEGADVFAIVARGYAVVSVDMPMRPRGRYGPHGPATDSVDGMTAALDAAAHTGWIDTAKIGVYGHSFGGYMVNVLVTRTRRFRAAVAVSGIADLVSDVAGGSGYGPEWIAYHQPNMEKRLPDAPERYVLNSPVLCLDDVTTPLLLVHGARDNTVHISQSEEMFRGLAQRDKVVELVRYRDESHAGDGFTDAAWNRAMDWFDEYLLSRRTGQGQRMGVRGLRTRIIPMLSR